MKVHLSDLHPVSGGSVRTDYFPALGQHVLRVRRSVTTMHATGERSFLDDVYCSDPHRDQRTGRSPEGPGTHDEHLLTLKLSHDQPWSTGWIAPGPADPPQPIAVTVDQALAFVIFHVLDEAPVVEEHLANAAFLFSLNKDLHAAVTAYAEWVA